MKLGTLAATVVSVAAIAITAGSADAEPLDTPRASSASGLEHAVAYRTELSDFTSPITTLTGGRFDLTDERDAVRLTADDGEVLVEIPLTFELSGHRLSVAHEISDDGRQLALTPKATATHIGELRSIRSTDRLIAELNTNIVGVVAGGALGALLGALVGMGFFSIITGPIGLLVGAIAGGYIMGGQPFSDAMAAVLAGQP